MRLPRHDILRSEVDRLHMEKFEQNHDFASAHRAFVTGLHKAFSPLTECAAYEYAKAHYFAALSEIEQHFKVDKNGAWYDIVLVTEDRISNGVVSHSHQQSYRDPAKAMETCRVLNALFKMTPLQTDPISGPAEKKALPEPHMCH